MPYFAGMACARMAHRTVFPSLLSSFAALFLSVGSAPAFERVQTPPKPEMHDSCPGFVASNRPRVIPAAFRLAALNADQVRITYAGHSTFLIESPKLVRIATDYNDYV